MGWGDVWSGGCVGWGMCGVGDTYMRLHRDTGKAVMNVGSPYSPVFVVTVKSSHSASD